MRLPDTEEKFQQLAYLAHDFQHAAEVYGRIIISERFVHANFKTIKPMDIGEAVYPFPFHSNTGLSNAVEFSVHPQVA